MNKMSRPSPGDVQAFVEFPTPHLLKEANTKYEGLNRPLQYADNGDLLPYPVPSSKNEVFNVDDYQAIDKFATKEMDVSDHTKSLEEFTKSLVQNHEDDQMAIVRIIFRWLSAQNINEFANIQTSENTVGWNLKRIHHNAGYYANVFLDMCRHAGLQGELIRGYAKHAHMELGSYPKADDLHSWVAVVVNEEWRFVDPHWGSSHMVGGNTGEWLLLDGSGDRKKEASSRSEGTAYACDETYFLTNPEQLIYSHMPKEAEELQMLARPATLREFVEMAFLKPAFFDLDLRLQEQRRCVLYAPEGEIVIRIGIPVGQRRGFTYRLWMSSEQNMDDTKLERFCFMQQKNDTLCCRIYFPVVGKFKFELFGRDTTDMSSKTNTFKQVCSYIIHCNNPAQNVKAFPENTRQEWGPGPDLYALGLKPITHDDALIEAQDGTVEVRFKCERPVEVLHQLHSNNKTIEQLAGHVVHYIDKEKKELVVRIKLPESGDYAFNLFAKDAGSPDKLSNVCSYVVSSENPASDPRPYPNMANGSIGSTAGAKMVHLRLKSHKLPLIDCPETGELDLEFESSEPCQTTTNLVLHANGDNVKQEDLVWITQDGNNISYKVIFPESGVYVLNIFAKGIESGGSFPHVYTCLINTAVPKETCMPFPKSFAPWKSGCKIIEPSTATLPAHSKLKFSAIIPEVHAVSAISSQGWTTLEKDLDGVWSAEVVTPDAGEEVQLSAQLEEGSKSYSALLSYKVQSAEEFNIVKEEQQMVQQKAIQENEQQKEKEKNELERRQKDFEKTKKDLLDSMDARDSVALREAIKAVENKRYVSRLREHIEEARKLLISLENVKEHKETVLQMDQNTILEMRKDDDPPKLVHEVMVAALLLLGDDEDVTREWSDCQKRLITTGTDALPGRVTHFDVTSLHPEIASRALQIIGKYRVDDVIQESPAAGLFYAWTVCMIEELRSSNPEARGAPAANVKRQKEIFAGNVDIESTTDQAPTPITEVNEEVQKETAPQSQTAKPIAEVKEEVQKETASKSQTAKPITELKKESEHQTAPTAKIGENNDDEIHKKPIVKEEDCDCQKVAYLIIAVAIAITAALIFHYN